MQFQDFMNRLALELNLPGLVPDASGACAVRLDDMTFSFYPDADGVFTVMCPLGRVDAGDLATQDALLAGNFFADGVGGSVLSLAWDGRAYLTQRFETATLDSPAFLAAMTRFSNQAEAWQRELAGRAPSSTTH